MEFQIKLDIFILQIEKNYWSSLFINYSFRRKADCSFIKFQTRTWNFHPLNWKESIILQMHMLSAIKFQFSWLKK